MASDGHGIENRILEHHGTSPSFHHFCLLRYHLSSGGKSSISGQCSSILHFSIFFP
jgi:hypothetical protein